MSEHLSQRDVERLLSDPSPTSRADLAAKIARQFDGVELTDGERRLAEDIIRLMARDAVTRVRQSLAENLKASPGLPRDVALALARDVEEVAIPILSVSQVLTDTDLIEIVRSGTDLKHEAIARRSGVSADVANELIDKGSENAVAALVANETAELGENTLNKVIDRFGQSERVQEPLVHRSALPMTVAERLVAVVSEKLREHLAASAALPEQTAADLILRSRERATVSLLVGQNDEGELERLISQLSQTGRLTPSLVVRAVCTGDIDFFEAAMAELADIPVANARMLIHDAGRLGLKSVYERAHMPAALLPACRIAVDVAHETPFDGEEGDRERHRRRMIERILTQYEDLASDDLDYLLVKLGDLMVTGERA